MVRCGRKRPPSTAIPARTRRRGRRSRAGRARCGRGRRDRGRPRGPGRRRRSGNAPPPAMRVSKAVRLAAARPRRSRRSSTFRSGTAARKARVRCICSASAHRKSAASRRTSRNSSRCSTATSGGWTATNISATSGRSARATRRARSSSGRPCPACVRAGAASAEPVARGARRPGVGAVGDQGDGHEDRCRAGTAAPGCCRPSGRRTAAAPRPGRPATSGWSRRP